MDSDCGSHISDTIKVRPGESVSQPRTVSTDDPSSEIGGDISTVKMLNDLEFEREISISHLVYDMHGDQPDAIVATSS